MQTGWRVAPTLFYQGELLADAPALAFPFYRFIGAESVAAEAVTHRGDGSRCLPSYFARCGQLYDRLSNHRRRHVHVQCVAD